MGAQELSSVTEKVAFLYSLICDYIIYILLCVFYCAEGMKWEDPVPWLIERREEKEDWVEAELK